MTGYINFALYQTGWFACVLGAAFHWPWLGLSCALVLVAIHFLLVRDRWVQFQIVAMAALVGFLVDTSLLWLGVFQFSEGLLVRWLPPPWMTVLWIQFATTFRYSLSWLGRRYLLASVFGLMGAPLAFYAGESLGAVRFLSPRILHFSLLAGLWAIAIPLVFYLANRMASRSFQTAGYRAFE